MRARAAVLLLCAAALVAAAVPRAAANSASPLLDPQAYNDFLQDIFGELNSLHLISTSGSSASNEGLGTSGSAPADTDAAAKRRLLTFNPLTSVQDFFSNVLGGNWTQHLPASWALPSFNWNTLGTFEYTNNLQYFLQNVNLTKPTSLADMANQVAEAEAAFCTDEVYTPSTKVYSSCTGPSITLALVPKVCVLDAVNHAVVCDPPKLVLNKNPGSCTHEHYSATTWVGKECKIAGTVGFAKASEKGGAPYSIPLKTVSVGGFTF